MTAYVIQNVRELCAHLMRERLVYAQREQDGEAHWLKLEDATELASPPLRPMYSPKQFLFAEREPLFVFDGKRFVETLPQVPPFVLFGVTACDLTAIAYQDQFFANDAYYQQRRAAMLLVGVDCATPCKGAFCHTMESGPAVREGMADLVLCPQSDGSHIVLAQTEAGAHAIAGMALAEAPGDHVERRANAESAAIAQMNDASHITEGIARINQSDVTAQTWEAIGLQCVSCSGCTTVCPTCSCSTTREQPGSAPSSMTRERVWDSCLLEGFQREASGHHPAGAMGQRVERYWYHKLSDDFRTDFGRYGCVGCGRCDTVCPGSIGAHSTLRRLASS